jgi:hypothetical protein
MRSLAVAALCLSICYANADSQSDWSGGPGFTGPVSAWEDCFSLNSGTNWSSPGQLGILEQYLSVEHEVDGAFSLAFRVLSGDIDGDGDEDVLASGDLSSALAWWENENGLGTIWTKHTIDGGLYGASGICLVDVDSDGDEDVLGAARGAEYVLWWENENGLGTIWTKHTIDESFPGGCEVSSADIDGDGDPDALGSSDMMEGINWWENADGVGLVWIEHSVDANFYAALGLGLDDIDGDGDTDVIGAAYGDDEIAWWENENGLGTEWTKHSVAELFDGACSISSGDMDGDGDRDLIGSAYHADTVIWWENVDGVGMIWEEHEVASSLAEPYGLDLEDLDGDGDQDVLTTAHAADRVSWWENTDGTGSAWIEHVIDGAFDGAFGVESTDIDGDSDREILGAAYDAGMISWWDLTSFASSATLESSILYTGCDPDWGTLLWSSQTPPGTSVSFQVRASDDYTQMGAWSDTLTAPCSLHGLLSDNSSYVQYRPIFETADPDTTPTLLDVTVTWDPLGIGDFGSPEGYFLSPMTPNPAGPSPSISFGLPEAGMMELSIFDASGRVIEEIGPSEYQAGYHSIQLQGLGEGIYFARMQTGYFTATQRFAVVE